MAHDLAAIVAWYRERWPWLPAVAIAWVKPDKADPGDFDPTWDWGSYVRRGRERLQGRGREDMQP